MASPGRVSQTYAAAMDKASQYFPTQLSGPLSSRRRSSQPSMPSILVVVRRHRADDLYIAVPPDSSLLRLREACEIECGVPVASQRLFIEEERPVGGGGLVSALRSTASQLTSRERVRESLVDWVNFIFLPEAVNREVRGRGLVSWFKENVLPKLQDPPPHHVAHATILLLGGRRGRLELSSTATVQRLREAAERQTGLPVDCQRLVISEQIPHSLLVHLFWSCARVVFALSAAAVGVGVAWVRWIVLGPEADQTMTLQLQTHDGKAVHLAVRQDVTLAQLQHMVQLNHGDGVNLQGLVLAGGASVPPL